MKLLWNVDNTVAISFKAIELFSIVQRDEDTWSVLAWYNRTASNVYVAETKSQCITFIDKMEEYL